MTDESNDTIEAEMRDWEAHFQKRGVEDPKLRKVFAAVFIALSDMSRKLAAGIDELEARIEALEQRHAADPAFPTKTIAIERDGRTTIARVCERTG